MKDTFTFHNSSSAWCLSVGSNMCCGQEHSLWGGMASTPIAGSSLNSWWLQALSWTSCSLLFYLKPSLQLHGIICEDVWLNRTDCILPPLPHLQVTIPTPSSFCMLRFSLPTKNVPQLDKFPINFYPCLHLIRKLEECILLTQKVNGHETPQGRKNHRFLQCRLASHLVVRF